MGVTNRMILEIVVEPVCISVLIVIRRSPSVTAGIDFDSRIFRRVRCGSECIEPLDSTFRKLDSLAGIDPHFVDITGKINRRHHLRHIDRRTEPYRSAVMHRGLSRTAAFCSNKNYSVCCPCSIYSRCRSILEHGHALHIRRIDILKTLFDTIDKYIWLTSVDGSDTSYIELHCNSRFSSSSAFHRISLKIQSRNIALKCIRKICHRTRRHCARLHNGNRGRDGVFLLHIHSYYYSFIYRKSVTIESLCLCCRGYCKKECRQNQVQSFHFSCRFCFKCKFTRRLADVHPNLAIKF